MVSGRIASESAARRVVAFAAADAATVLVFAVVGARNHDSGGGALGTLSIGVPFWIALAGAWALPVARRDPLSTRAVTTVWLLTVGGGMVLRNIVFGDGTAPAFVLVATGFLGAAMAGWRAVARRRTQA